jgi:predicted O-methyltransferase YrrM
MVSKFQLSLNYLYYFFTASTKYDVHSPFIFDFTVNVINARKHKPAYHAIELVRSQMLKSTALVDVLPLGAKPKEITQKIELKKLAKNTSKSAKYAELLERICAYMKPTYAIEIGTSVGISTLYQSIGIENGFLITLEGNPKSVEIAKFNSEKIGLQNIQFIEGLFENTLPEVVKQLPHIDYVFFDGNHSLEATLQYFEWCLPKVHENTIFIFDDIRWSDEMNLVWQKIKNHPQVTVSVDLFFLGIVFFRPNQAKEHFTLRY